MTPLLRPLRSGDAAELAELLTRNRDFLTPWEPLRPESFFTPAGQEAVVADNLNRQEAGTMHCLVIMDETGALAGRINLNNIVRGPFQSASMGYWLSASAGGQGRATAAVAEMVRIAFTNLGLHRLEAGTIPENLRSQAVLRRNAFEQFGYAPSYLQIAGRYQDHLLFQRLAPQTAN
ncbi:GNAT family N-acetyltransferase [Propionicimonas sp.]|uniref:GNAT family N-acetyltransferase n=1 Tax=Propionicimonas sp. TaxID=1955623 RepID=UPI0017E6DCBA|nr:GNAT family N-acetyltransferase [Propionicimonas sp.]MBU3977044.1 GNAT family N-acetyltransferase [Actinomycetota bacterium]MBA3020614.1 GNAT family N-acetyltransferase [Propionicimonas sp.]MBU3984984.1 GNAT family N-acetyltransferase [Actinomycetota bacterium]MBU4007059.1 GNAT family N-acetyltransferase [Actinomycetota bacterium]MBU4064812.1 GNAT family N-acetyltransferase [Actinomycetota bacterium]